MKSFHHFKLRCGFTQKPGGEHLLSLFPFCMLESELISSNSLFFTNLFRTNITLTTRSNSTKKLYWLFTKEIIALATLPTSLSRIIFYLRPTVIYVLVFLPSVVLFYKKTCISLSNITRPSLKKHFINTCGVLFSFRLKIIRRYRSRCVSIRFLEGNDNTPRITFTIGAFWPLSVMKIMQKKSIPTETEGLSDIYIGTER